MEKHSESRLSVFHDVPTFSRTCIFFLLIFSLLTLLTSAFQLSILSEVSLLNFLRLQCVLHGVQIHPPQVSRTRQGCPFTRARLLKPALPFQLFANPRENTQKKLRLCPIDHPHKQGINLSLLPFSSAMPDNLLVPAPMPLLPFVCETAIILGVTLLRAVEPLTCRCR